MVQALLTALPVSRPIPAIIIAWMNQDQVKSHYSHELHILKRENKLERKTIRYKCNEAN